MGDPVAPTGKLDLAAVTELHQHFNDCSGQDVVLDLGNVTAMGALCLQLCLAAARDALKAGKSFEVVNVPDVVAAQIESMGFTATSLAEGAV